MKIIVLGLDSRTARVELREQAAMTPDQVLQLLKVLAAEKLFSEIMVLSTCNRTEFYVCGGTDPAQALGHLLGHVAQVKNVPPLTETEVFFRHEGPEAVRHLFRVAASLESQMVGEHEIMGQVKAAYKQACDARTAKFLFHKLMHWAFRTGKRVMTETALGQGTASIAQAAVDLVAQVFSRLSDKTVLLIGAGETAEASAQALLRAGVRKLIVANRTLRNAEQLAGDLSDWFSLQQQRSPMPEQEFQCPALKQMLALCTLKEEVPAAPVVGIEARAIALEEVPSALGEVDVVISSTGSQDPVLTYDKMQPALSRRRQSLLMIDIAVPRDIDPRLAELPNVFLYNIDAMEGLVEMNVRRRMAEVPLASAIVEDEVRRFQQWFASLEVVPTIQLLEQRILALQQAEVDRYINKAPPEAREQMQALARTLCRKILHDPIVFLKQLAAQNGAADLSAIQTLRQIFRLDSTDRKE
jgi:glutamyl-tRNA reductase